MRRLRRHRAYRWLTRQLTRLIFGEYEALARIGMPGMPNASRVWFIVAGFFARLAFLRIVHCEWVHFHRIPKTGVIIASNHLSSADPAMMASAIYPRSPRYMAKVELFQKEPIIGYLFALSGAFPVRRGAGDRLALREAERLLEEGAVVGMFPEGHRSETGALIQAHQGTALLALRSGAPVVAVGINGSERLRGGWRALPQARSRPHGSQRAVPAHPRQRTRRPHLPRRRRSRPRTPDARNCRTAASAISWGIRPPRGHGPPNRPTRTRLPAPTDRERAAHEHSPSDGYGLLLRRAPRR